MAVIPRQSSPGGEPPSGRGRLELALLGAVAAVLLWSGIAPYDRLTWWLEVAPVLIGVPLIAWTRRRFPLTSLLLVLVALHAVVLCVGGRYTYARVPIGYQLADLFGWERNPYDRIGHLFQGFVPAILTREVLRRTTPLRPGKWLAFLCVSVCLAFSAFYELIEWWAALLTGSAAEDFLGTQGDVWDTQWDMCLALIGATASLALLSRWHERQLSALYEKRG